MDASPAHAIFKIEENNPKIDRTDTRERDTRESGFAIRCLCALCLPHPHHTAENRPLQSQRSNGPINALQYPERMSQRDIPTVHLQNGPLSEHFLNDSPTNRRFLVSSALAYLCEQTPNSPRL